MHRQQRPPATGNRGRDPATSTRRCRGAERQPEFRGSDSPADARELPRVAADGGDCGAAWHGARRLAARSAGDRRGGPASGVGGAVAVRRGDRRDRGRVRPAGGLCRGVCAVFRGCARMGRGRRRRCGRVRVAAGFDLFARAAVRGGRAGRTTTGEGHRARGDPRGAGRFRDDRPHFARRKHSARQSRRPLPDRARRGPAGFQQLRFPSRQPRGHGARHLRERTAAQPNGGPRGWMDRARAQR